MCLPPKLQFYCSKAGLFTASATAIAKLKKYICCSNRIFPSFSPHFGDWLHIQLQQGSSLRVWPWGQHCNIWITYCILMVIWSPPSCSSDKLNRLKPVHLFLQNSSSHLMSSLQLLSKSSYFYHVYVNM